MTWRSFFSSKFFTRINCATTHHFRRQKVGKLTLSTENQSAFEYRKYWEDNYASGGNSGLGSYGVLALFKAEVINEYIKEQQVKSVIEFGCGDGNQLLFMKYADYLGLDISPTSVQMCARMFGKDLSKSFLLYHPKSFYNQGYLKKYNDFSITRKIEQKYPDLSSASFLILEKNPPTAT
jgi:SAM-dependent methyltransferase